RRKPVFGFRLSKEGLFCKGLIGVLIAEHDPAACGRIFYSGAKLPEREDAVVAFADGGCTVV
ncbi:hypothetical protein, partial [Neisseria sp. HMSC075C10]|uniref:hypothetical protein n=1 Tax=Neisseria sp. HMSC075C10 TaxID=1739539 RepID=UPI001AEF886E